MRWWYPLWGDGTHCGWGGTHCGWGGGTHCGWGGTYYEVIPIIGWWNPLWVGTQYGVVVPIVGGVVPIMG